MKKFSWIFALILALSIGFIGCPAADDDDDSSSSSSSSSESGIKFGPPSGAIVLKDGTSTTGVAIDQGTLEYLSSGYGFTYTYGASGYDTVILRFKYDLGDAVISDYGCVTFKWSTVGFSDDGDNVSKNKKLYLLASYDEDDLKPQKSRTQLNPFVISTNDDSKSNWYDDTGAPQVNGNSEVTVTLPIVAGPDFTGEVWFAVYVHAQKGQYTIRDFNFGGDPSAPTVSGPDSPLMPPPPPIEGAQAYSFSVKLIDEVIAGDASSSWNQQGAVLNNNNNTTVVPDVTENGDGSITVPFTLIRQRINIALSDAQIDTLKKRINDNVTIDIDGNEVDGSGNVIAATTAQFRVYIGHITEEFGGGWNATGGSGNGTFDEKKYSEQTFGTGADVNSRLGYVIIQYVDVDAPTTILIRSINIHTTVPQLELVDTEDAAYDSDEGGLVYENETGFNDYADLVNLPIPAITLIRGYTYIIIDMDYYDIDGNIVTTVSNIYNNDIAFQVFVKGVEDAVYQQFNRVVPPFPYKQAVPAGVLNADFTNGGGFLIQAKNGTNKVTKAVIKSVVLK